jgi:2-oxoglutarate ferredoxin oxidoreductase subunit gamma
MRDGKNVTYLPSYGAEVRGGTANCTVAISDEEIFSPVASSPDYAVIMNRPSLTKYEGTITEGGIIIQNSSTTLDSIMNGLTEIVKGKKASLMKLNRKGLDKGAEYVLKGA